MALTLPTVFSQDIEGQDTHLSPLVIIGTRNNGSWVRTPIYITAEYKKWGTSHSYPLLLNIPSIKESIDLQTRKYKISSVSLQLSNVEYAGKRLSERFSGSMINTEVRIFWYSPNTRSLQFVDPAEGGSYLRNSAFQVYYGKIRRYAHSSEKVTLTVEDDSQEKYHVDLPPEENYITSDSAPDEYVGRSIPIVYGKVLKSPCVFTNGFNDVIAASNYINFSGSFDASLANQFDFQIANPFSGTVEQIPTYLTPIWIYTGKGYINVNEFRKGTPPYNLASRQLVYDPPYEGIVTDYLRLGVKIDINNIPFGTLFQSSLLYTYNHRKADEFTLDCYDFTSDFSASLSSPKQDPTMQDLTTSTIDSDGVLQKAINGTSEPNPFEWVVQRRLENTYDLNTEEFWYDAPNDIHVPIEDLILFHDTNEGFFSIDIRRLVLVHEFTNSIKTYESLLLKMNFDFRSPSYEIKMGKDTAFEGSGSEVITVELDDNPTLHNFVHGLIINGTNISKFCPHWINASTGASGMGGDAGNTMQKYDYAVFQTDYENNGNLITNPTSSHNLPDEDSPTDIATGISWLYGYHPIPADFDNTGLFDVFNFNSYAPAVDVKPFSSNADAAINVNIQSGYDEAGTVETNANENSNYLYSNLTLSGDLRSIQFLRHNTVVNPFQYEFYADVRNSISKNINITSDIVSSYIGTFTTETNIISDGYEDLNYGFSIHEKINSKALIENLSSASPYVYRFDNMGRLKTDQIKWNGGMDWNLGDGTSVPSKVGHEIKQHDVIDYSFTRTKIEEVCTQVELKFNYDYGDKNLKNTTSEYLTASDGANVDDLNGVLFNGYSKGYYGLTDHNTLTIEDDRSKLIRSPYTACTMAYFYLTWYANQKLVIKLKLPLKWLNIEVSDIIHFAELLDGIKPYGIDYTEHSYQSGVDSDVTYPFGTLVNGQVFTPSFMVTSTNKKIDSVEVECMQLPALFAAPSEYFTVNDEYAGLYSNVKNNKIYKDLRYRESAIKGSKNADDR